MHFLAHIHTKDTNFIFGTPHTQFRYTQTNGYTHRHTDTDVVPLSHIALFVTCMYAKDTNFIFGICNEITIIVHLNVTQWFLAIFMEHRLNTAFSVA